MVAPMNLDPFAQHLRERDRAPGTVRSYCQELDRFAIWFEQTNGQALTPNALTARDVRDYREHGQAVARSKPGTINRRLMAIRAYCNWLVEMGVIQASPAQHVKLVKELALAPKSLDRKQMAALERELDQSVNAAATSSAKFLCARDRAIVLLLANSGLRVAELCALELDDVALKECSGLLTVQRGKGNKRRQVPLNVEASRPLDTWLPLRKVVAIGSFALFCDRQGQPLRPRGVQRAIEEYGRRAKVAVTPHVLRHTFAKSLADAGVPTEQIAALLGHSKLETTRRYTQPTERDLAAAVERLEL